MRRAGSIALALLALGLAAPGAALGAVPVPAWRIDVASNSTAAPGATHDFLVQIANTGTGAADGTSNPIVVSGTLPAGLRALGAVSSSAWDCTATVPGSQSFSCTYLGDPFPAPFAIQPAGFAVLTLQATVDGDAAGTLTSSFGVSGGSAASSPAASTVDPVAIAAAPRPFGVDAFDGTVLDAAGAPFTQAGGHPFTARVSIDFNTTTDPVPLRGDLWPVEPVKDVLAELPPGLVGDPTAADHCTAAQLAAGGIQSKTLCPPAAQVGVALVRVNGGGARNVLGPLPIYNMVSPPDVPARFAFNAAGTVVTMDGELRSATDYGLSVRLRDVAQGLAVAGATLTFWGVPADPVHDAERQCPGEVPPANGGRPCQDGGALRPFLRNPTSCTEPGVGLPVGVQVDSWVHPGAWQAAQFVSHLPPGYPFAPADWGPEQGTTGCDAVPFAPGLSVAPDSREAGAPSGYAFALTLPQDDEDADSPGQADVRRVVLRLPEGVRVNPSAADGLQGCSREQVGLDSAADARCPDGSRVGSLTVETPLLDEPLTGSVYLASPGANPFGTLLAVYLVAKGPGLIVKLAGRVESDPLSGRLTATFDDVPQLPFSRVRVAFDGGSRAVLVNPPLCGAYAVTGELTAWSGAVRPVSGGFAVDAGCFAAGARPFAPGFAAGVESPVAGGSSPFHLRLTRSDADEELGRVTVRVPRGLLGRLSDVDLCADAAAAAGTCGPASLIGSVVAGAGAGPLPFYIGGGRVYMTGPYGGAPFGLSIAVPAVAGPFDLGLVVVRAAVFVDRHTTALRVVTDPLPQVLEGIPLQLRDVRVAVDRPGFMVLPTGCGAKSSRAVVSSTAGRVVGVSAPFRVGECGRLPFRPRLRLFVGSRGHTRARQSTPLTAVLTQRPGEAGIRRLSVTLPKGISAQLSVIEDACSPEEFAVARCESARVATAVAVTPLLRDPLRGGVYLVRPAGQPLPNLVVALRGQVSVDLVGRVSIPGGDRLAASFGAVPDVPISRVVLRFHAGSRGVVGLGRGLCVGAGGASTRPRPGLAATAVFAGQNGVREQVRELVVRGCGHGRGVRGR